MFFVKDTMIPKAKAAEKQPLLLLYSLVYIRLNFAKGAQVESLPINTSNSPFYFNFLK